MGRTARMAATAAMAALVATVAAASAQNQTASNCSALQAPTVDGATVVSMQAMQMTNMPVRMANGTAMPLTFCNVNVTLTHGSAGDKVRVEVWMPLASSWNGRFQGTGGSGFAAGLFGAAMGPAVMDGYAAASTDAGVGRTGNFTQNGSDMALTQQLITNFANLSIHEMAVVGKAMVQQFYGAPATRSYFNGCSTGGRQGMMEAQRFPTDFDGILSGSPAINWDRLMPADLWPFSVMQAANQFVPACVLEAFSGGVMNACDALDGVRDGVITSPGACTFDPATMVGRSIACSSLGINGTTNANASSTTITATQADIFRQILAGPTSTNGQQLWYGLLPGASPLTLATSRPLSLGASWLQNFVLALNPNSSLSAESVNTALASQQAFTDVFQASQSLFDTVIGTSDPDLTAFQRAGGKMIGWHGLADQLVFSNGTFDYVQRVMDLMNSNSGTAVASTGTNNNTVDGFFRVFSAPGVQHCGGGPGAAPADPLTALVSWVENGTAPDTLPAQKLSRVNGTATTITRNLCRYPQMLVYSGSGDANMASSWMCMPGPSQKVLHTATDAGSLLKADTTSSASSQVGMAVAASLPLFVAFFL